VIDRFMEEVVVKHRRGLQEMVYYISFVLMVICALYAMYMVSWLLVQFDMFALVTTVVVAGLAACMYFFRDRLRTEYEYTFTNGILDFAQVFDNKKRKNLGGILCNKVEAFGKVRGSAFQRYATMRDVKHMRWFLNREAELYYFYFQKDGNKRLIVFEPSEKLVEYIRHYLPRNAEQE